MDMNDYGVVYLIETLDKKGPLSLVGLKREASRTFQDGEWSDYLQTCFKYLLGKNKIIRAGKQVYDIIDECRPKPPEKLLDPNREYYCKKCFYVLRKLVFMRTMKDTGLHMCPDCSDVQKIDWMEAHSYCDIFVLHYRKMKEQIGRDMELQEDG